MGWWLVWIGWGSFMFFSELGWLFVWRGYGVFGSWRGGEDGVAVQRSAIACWSSTAYVLRIDHEFHQWRKIYSIVFMLTDHLSESRKNSVTTKVDVLLEKLSRNSSPGSHIHHFLHVGFVWGLVNAFINVYLDFP